MSSGAISTRMRTIAAGVALVLGAAALLIPTLLDRRLTVERVGSDRAVNPGALDPGDIDSNNSPSLAQDPTRPQRLAVVNRIDTPDYACALQVSRDGGRRWAPVKVPIPRGEGRKCYAPDVTFAADGTLHMSFVTLQGNGNTPAAGWVTSSTDGGRTLSPPRRVLDELAFQVRLTADLREPKRLYLTWLQAASVGLLRFSEPGNRVMAARSQDGGRSWSKPAAVSDAARGRVVAPSAAVGPDGSLYVLYLDVGDDRLDYDGAHQGRGGRPYRGHFTLVVGRSADGGKTWQESVVDERVVPTRRFIAFLPPTPSLAVDPTSGRLFVAFEDGRRSPADVHLWSLTRGASDWEGPTRVNDAPAGEDSWQYLPRIGVAPDGRLDVVYYDRREDPANRRNDVSAQSSSDGGKTFSSALTLTASSFDSRIGAGSELGLPDLGSRLALVSDASALLAAWTDTRAGTVASNKQDVAFARASVTGTRGLSTTISAALRGVGIALLLAAVALLAGPRIRGARARRQGEPGAT